MYTGGMVMTSEELTRRLAVADRVIVLLRQASIELEAMGREILAKRAREPYRPDHDPSARR